jgi:acyl-CoA dehydrogenase
MEMEAQLQAARLLTWRAAWMMDNGMRNNLEASMAKAKAGLVVTLITQKAIELLGPSATRASSSSRSGCATPRSTTSSRAPSRSTR